MRARPMRQPIRGPEQGCGAKSRSQLPHLTRELDRKCRSRRTSVSANRVKLANSEFASIGKAIIHAPTTMTAPLPVSPGPRPPAPIRMRLHFAGPCDRCGKTLAKGALAFYDPSNHAVRCIECPCEAIDEA